MERASGDPEAFSVLGGSCRSLASLWYQKDGSSCTVHWLFYWHPQGHAGVIPCSRDSLHAKPWMAGGFMVEETT